MVIVDETSNNKLMNIFWLDANRPCRLNQEEEELWSSESIEEKNVNL